MEVSRLSNDLKYVEINGVTINLEERSRIDLACMQLDSDVNQGPIYFWGKIRGKYSVVGALNGKREASLLITAQQPTTPLSVIKFKK